MGDTDRYNTAKLWVEAINDVWTKDYVFSAFKKTGMIPFNRNTHLIKNKSDIEIGDAIQEAEEIMKRELIRQQLTEDSADDAHNDEIDADECQDEATVTSTHVQEFRLVDIENICGVHRPSDSNQPVVVANRCDVHVTCILANSLIINVSVTNRYGLTRWPRYEATLTDVNLWCDCLKASPGVVERFRATDPLELYKFHGVGILLEDEKNSDTLTPEQALILGYMQADAVNTLSVPMLKHKIETLLNCESVSWKSVVKYSKTLTTAAQLQMDHGEAAVVLDLNPTCCNEAALVQDFMDTAPKPKDPNKRTRQTPANSASMLFNKGNSHVYIRSLKAHPSNSLFHLSGGLVPI